MRGPVFLSQKKTSRSARRERGQSLVEVAVSLPVIILLLLGITDFGLAMFSYTLLRDAAQEGALYGSFDPGNKEEIANRARSIRPASPGSPAYSPVDLRSGDLVEVNVKIIGDDCRGFSSSKPNSVQVSVSFDYLTLMPFAAQVAGSDAIRLTATATNVILQPPCR